MDTNIYRQISGTYTEKRNKLKKKDKEWLEAVILDFGYNEFLSTYSDYKDKDKDKHGHGKRVPYIGWFWRDVTFSNINMIPLGNCGSFIGFMENNKWDYPERFMTPKEAKTALSIIDEAIALSQKSGEVSEILNKTYAKLDELWDFMQTLKV